MDAALYFFDSQIAGVVKSRLPASLYESQFVQYRIAVTCLIQQKLSALIEANQEILVGVMTGLGEPRQGIAGTSDFVTTHRTRYIKDHSDGNGRVVIAEKRDVLRLFLIENREGILVHARDVTAVGVGYGDGEGNQIGIG